MGFPKEFYSQAVKKISEYKTAAEETAKARLNELSKIEPRFEEIKNELQRTGLELVKAVLYNKNNVEKLVSELQQKNQALQKERLQLLKNRGLPEDYLTVKYSCQNCNDEGYKDGEMCECLKKELRKLMFNSLNVASNLSLCDFSSFNLNYYPQKQDENGVSAQKKMKTVFEFCKAYAQNFNEESGNLLLFGKTGLGKTHLSLSIAKEVIIKGYGVIYDSTPNLMDKIEREKFSGDDTETLKAVLECDLLILDDLGAEFATPFVISAIYNIINSRINMQKSTIISTNLDFKELESRYSERLVSRLLGEYTSLRFLGNDIRLVKKAEKRETVE